MKGIKHTGWLIQADDVRTAPSSSTENDLDLLTTGKTTHGVVRDELRLETEVGEVCLNLTTNERTKETKTLSFTCVDFEDFLLTRQDS